MKVVKAEVSIFKLVYCFIVLAFCVIVLSLVCDILFSSIKIGTTVSFLLGVALTYLVMSLFCTEEKNR